MNSTLHHPTSDSAPPRARLLVALLLVVGAIAFGLHLQSPGYYEGDELFYMAGALTANESGERLVPMYHGEYRLKKPPLPYWLVSLSYEAFGVGVAQARLPSALAGLGCLAGVGWLGWLLFESRRASLYGMCALLGSELFLRQAHLAITDQVLALLVLLSCCGFAATIRGRPWGGWLAWAGMGAAVLQKGPVGLLIPLATAVLWMCGTGRKRTLSWRRLFPASGIILFLLMVLPWPLLVWHRLGWAGFADPIQEEVGGHLRLSAGRTATALFRYALDLLRSVFPWSLLLLLMRRTRTDRQGVLFLVAWVALTALVFSFAILKQRWRYMIPAMPALALLVGHLLDTLGRDDPRPVRRLLAAGTLIWLAVALATGVPPLLAAWKSGPAAGVVTAALGLAIAAIGTGWLVSVVRRPHGLDTWAVGSAVVLALTHVLLAVSPRALQPPHSAFALARAHLRSVDAGQVALVGVTGHDASWAWMGAGRSLAERSPAEVRPERDRLLLTTPDAWAAAPAELRDRYRLRARQDHAKEERKHGRAPAEPRTYLLLERIEPSEAGTA